MTRSRQEIIAGDQRHVWHPYTPMSDYLAAGDPLVVARAAGSRLYDHDGRSYLDANSAWWTSLLGHNHPRLVRALKEQADSMCHVAFGGITHEPAVVLAERLVAAAPPGMSRVFYSDNGSTAVEVAVKMALQFHAQNGAPERTRLLSLEHAFHGETWAVASLGGVAAFRAGVEFSGPEVRQLPSPAKGEARALEALEHELGEDGARVAALVVEPLVQGAGGMLMYGPEFLRRARALTEAAGALFIVDEVFTGFGRTGRFWAVDHAGVSPDILCTAKGLSGGVLPFAATLTTERVFGGFLGDRARALYYGHTYTGNPLGARVAAETLAVYEDEAVLAGVPERAARIAESFARLGRLDGAHSARSLGMCAALELGGDPSSAGYLADSGWRVSRAARKRGAYLRPLGSVVYVAPPLNIPLADLDELLGIVEESLTVVLAGKE